jgi:hypothetical protein
VSIPRTTYLIQMVKLYALNVRFFLEACARRLQSVLHAFSQSYTPEQPRCMRQSRLHRRVRLACADWLHACAACCIQSYTPVQPAVYSLTRLCSLPYTACLTRLCNQLLRMQRVASRHALRAWLVDCSCMLPCFGQSTVCLSLRPQASIH